MPGPLQGVKVLEIAALGPAPYGGMLLADLGADIVRVDRATSGKSDFGIDPKADVLNRGRRSLALNLKDPKAVEVVLRLVEQSDMLTEGFRPGVMERLGLGPDVCLARNPRLVYGRMTGWGQDGPLAMSAGHDINYIALSGVLGQIGRKGETPMFPLNLVGDMYGGMMLAYGLVAALVEAKSSGRGQVVDVAMLEGAVSQLSGVLSMAASGMWHGGRGGNVVDSGSHFYEVYETADGRFMAVGAVEPQFYAALRKGAGLDDPMWDKQMDSRAWPRLKEELARIFKSKTRDEWVAAFDGLEACVSPVLDLDEVAAHPHNRARGVFVERDGVLQAAPAPRFSRTPGAISSSPPVQGQHSRDVLETFGFSSGEIEDLMENGVTPGDTAA